MGAEMKEKIYVSFMLITFILSVSMAIYEAGRIRELESRVEVMNIQISETEKNSRIARQDSEFILKLITENKGGEK